MTHTRDISISSNIRIIKKKENVYFHFPDTYNYRD